MKKIALAAIAAALIPAQAHAATASGEATATVVAPISITHDVGAVLDFGAFAAAAGQISVDTAGLGTPSGITLLSGTSADSFTVSGDAGRSFSIATTSGSVTNGTDTMNFTTTAAGSGTLSGVIGSGSGTASFAVGGTLTVGGTESAGTYSGTYSATVDYN